MPWTPGNPTQPEQKGSMQGADQLVFPPRIEIQGTTYRVVVNPMTKKEILMQLRAAKTAHIQWRSYAQALMAGLPVDQDHVPVVSTTCKFGKWYYGAGQSLSSLSAYEAIELPHDALHQIYMRIFKILFSEQDRSLFQKLFGTKGQLDKKRQVEAEALMQHLLSVSRTLLDAIALLEQEVMNLSDEEIEALF
jgi:hypothetical protein